VSPKAVAVAGLSALAIAASGCGGGSDAEAEFHAAFKKSFGEAPWYHSVTGIEVKDSAVEITTDLDPDSDYAGSICTPAYGVAIQTGAIDGGEAVFVKGRDGVALAGCG
jgi:hypothetical protein